jgi:hypothetical protein
MQHLGLGADIALVTASTIGDIDTTILEVKPNLQTWRATYHWLNALKDGQPAPACPLARNLLPDLLPKPGSDILPLHVATLLEQVQEIRRASSTWTWHLPLATYEETAQAIVYRMKSNPCGNTWSRKLELPSTSPKI